MSEGFGALRKILSGTAKPGILPMQEAERFPHPDRKTFYEDYPGHGKSPIKSIITKSVWGGSHDETATVSMLMESGTTAEFHSSVLFDSPNRLEISWLNMVQVLRSVF